MQTKSKIQQITEALEKRDRFLSEVIDIMSKYRIGDNIFINDNGLCREAHTGYWIPGKSYDNVKEAVFNMTPTSALRIVDNKEPSIFVIGEVVESLGEILDTEGVIDLMTGKSII